MGNAGFDQPGIGIVKGCRKRLSSLADDFDAKSTSVIIIELGAEAKNRIIKRIYKNANFTLLSVSFQ